MLTASKLNILFACIPVAVRSLPTYILYDLYLFIEPNLDQKKKRKNKMLVQDKGMSYPSPFSIHSESSAEPTNRRGPTLAHFSTSVNLGNTGTAVPVSSILSGNVVITPTTANQTYTLPDCPTLLSTFGEVYGNPSLQAGNSLTFNVVNKGSQDAVIAASPTGSDNTQIVCSTGTSIGNFTGAVPPIGKVTQVTIDITNVYPGQSQPEEDEYARVYLNATGTYSIYTS